MGFLIGGALALVGALVIGLAVHNTHGNAWQILTAPSTTGTGKQA